MNKHKNMILAIVLLTAIVFISAAFFISQDQTKQEEEDITPQLLEEIKLPANMIPISMSVNSEENEMYLLTVEIEKETAIEEETAITEVTAINYLYVAKKEESVWKEPVQIDIQGYWIYKIMWDSDKLYFLGRKEEEVWDSESDYSMYSAELQGNQLTNIEKVKIDNEKVILLDCYDIKNGKAIILGNNSESGDMIYYLGTIDNGSIIEMEEINLGIDVNSQSVDTACLINEEKNIILQVLSYDSDDMEMIQKGDETYYVGAVASISYGIVDLSEQGQTVLKELDVSELKTEEQEFNAFAISYNSKSIYYALSGGEIYQAGYENIKEQNSSDSVQEETVEYKSGDTAYDAFDTSDFELTLRNKSDKSEKQGVFYEIFVRSFADSDGDGIGDFNGITAKLDYLKELGVDSIWLMPINQSSSYHGYDVTDYYSLNDDYGTEEDFKRLLDEAHKRGIKIIMDFVINHTSDSHPWFLNAVSSETSEYRNYYRWVSPYDSIDYSADDISNWGSEVWHKSGNAYYYGIFGSNMPDLNYNNPAVREEIKSAAAKWLNMGVDGFRLDAAMHIYGDNEFKQQENQLESNIQWWNEFAAYCETINPNVYLVGEAWQNDEILAEYAQPFDTKFNFAFEENMMEAVKNETAATEDGQNLSQKLEDILNEYYKADTNYLDGVFGTNHDQNRIMSQVNSIEKAKLVANIYMTLPGNPFIYYGEELGMLGEKPDEMIRTPFLWSKTGDMNTTWESDRQNIATATLEEQMADENSMYNFYKNIISVRKGNDALMNGSFKAVDTGNTGVMSYVRESDKQKLLVIHNFSANEQVIDCSEFILGEIVYTTTDNGSIDGSNVHLKGFETIILTIQ